MDTDNAPGAEDDGVIVLEGATFYRIAYGDERHGGVDIFSVPCHLCGAPPATAHRSSCPMGPGAHRRPLRCRDCGVAVGLVHVGDCGIEQCPRCGGQYQSCACIGTEDSDGDGDGGDGE